MWRCWMWSWMNCQADDVDRVFQYVKVPGTAEVIGNISGILGTLW